MFDPHTYRYPRTWAEVVSRYPSAGDEAIAIERSKRPLSERAVDGVLAVIIAMVLTVCALAYFDMWTK